MKNNVLLIGAIIVAIGALFFLHGAITGYFVQKVSYDDLCMSDADCSDGKSCCVIYESYGLCNYEDYCQSIEFLCKEDHECEPGTVCCISEGMEYGICNYEDRCMSIVLLSEYSHEVKSKAEAAKLSPSSAKSWLIALFLILTFFILWFTGKKRKKGK